MSNGMSFAALMAVVQAAAGGSPSLGTAIGPAPPPAVISGTAAPAPDHTSPPAPLLVTLLRDTPVELMALREVSTADAGAGTRFKLQVNKPVTVNGRTIVPAGAVAFGEVVTASDAGGLGKSGRMTARLLYIQLADTQIALDGEISAKGTGAGSAGVAVLFAGVTGLFHRGNNAKIKAGEILAGFIRDDVAFDVSGGTPRRVSPSSAPVPAQP